MAIYLTAAPRWIAIARALLRYDNGDVQMRHRHSGSWPISAHLWLVDLNIHIHSSNMIMSARFHTIIGEPTQAYSIAEEVALHPSEGRATTTQTMQVVQTNRA